MFEQKTKNVKKFLEIPTKQDLGDIVDYTNDLFYEAIDLNASDIHIEPVRDSVTVRFRESGDFLYIDRISHDEYAKLLSRIKILANLRIDERMRPQDGKIPFQ
jgi:type II secretory ATPase GspE/PulE/Tfp pilus assembly ATPase PilB-like protein